METISSTLHNGFADYMALIISFIALAFSVGQFCSERKRNRREATIHAFDKLEESQSVLYLFKLSKSEIENLVELKQKNGNQKIDDWDKLTEALVLIEHFSVGVNSKVYDLKTLNRMAGNKVISTFDTCNAFIRYKRNDYGNEKNYLELEKMSQHLLRCRK